MSSTLMPLNAESFNAEDRIFSWDVAEFGVATALALARLAPDIAALNRDYRKQVAARALMMLPEIDVWRGQVVDVFLRHDAVFVFAIHRDSQFGMANVVELHDATFVVDEVGRQQTLMKEGPLANLSTVHAFVSGRVISLSNETPEWFRDGWSPVLYRPDHGSAFMTTPVPDPAGGTLLQNLRPVTSARKVLMIPGRVKVWCQNPVHAERSVGHDRPGGEMG